MFKKIVQALSKVPGLGSLRRLLDDVDAPLANEKRRPEPRRPEFGQPGSAQRAKSAVPTSRGAPRSADGPPGVVSPVVSPGRAAPAVSPAVSPGRAAAAEFRQAPGPGAEQRPGPPGSPAVQSLGLAAIGPGRAFAFWKLSRQAIGRAREYLGERSGEDQATAVVLRVHDITLVDFDGSNARRTMDLSVGEGTVGAAPQNTETVEGNHYLELWTDGVLPPRSPQGDGPDTPSPTRIYCELGVQNSAGDFVAVAWSPILDLPSTEESPRELPVRALVNAEHSARWRPRLEPLPSSVSSPFETTSTARHALGTGETAPPLRLEIQPSPRRAVPVAVDLAASSAWTFSAPSSADLASGRDRQRGPGGVSSGLLVRRRLSRKGS